MGNANFQTVLDGQHIRLGQHLLVGYLLPVISRLCLMVEQQKGKPFFVCVIILGTLAIELDFY
jgi:hypothetical protein